MPIIKTGRIQATDGKPTSKLWEINYDYINKLSPDEYAWLEAFAREYDLTYATDTLITKEQRKELDHSRYVRRTGKPVFMDRGEELPDVNALSIESLDPAVLVEMKQESELHTKRLIQRKRRQSALRQTKFKNSNAETSQKLPT